MKLKKCFLCVALVACSPLIGVAVLICGIAMLTVVPIASAHYSKLPPRHYQGDPYRTAL